jgi:hypothetical protein
MPLRVKLHSNDPSAADATDQTIRLLPMNGNAHLVRGADGSVSFDENGWATVETTNPGFVMFALENQGYVADVIQQ